MKVKCNRAGGYCEGSKRAGYGETIDLPEAKVQEMRGRHGADAWPSAAPAKQTKDVKPADVRTKDA
jgi:hypothetical protein